MKLSHDVNCVFDELRPTISLADKTAIITMNSAVLEIKSISKGIRNFFMSTWSSILRGIKSDRHIIKQKLD